MNAALFRLSAKQNRLRVRAEIIRALRSFFEENDFLEVETPCRIPLPIPEAHIDPVSSENAYLQTSPEICMKRMLAGGYSRIFQICRCFRNEERGKRHLGEFTMLEWYAAGSDYLDMMTFCEQMLAYAARKISGEKKIYFQGGSVDFAPPWERLSVQEAFAQYASLSPEDALISGKYDEIMAFDIEPRLGREKPVFLYDYPAACAALAKRKRDDPTLAERFELYICGMEMCNAFSELRDPEEQRMRFKADRKYRANAGKSHWPLPDAFLRDLAYMPESSGNALGIDRLVMLFTDAEKIDDVVAFTPEDL